MKLFYSTSVMLLQNVAKYWIIEPTHFIFINSSTYISHANVVYIYAAKKHCLYLYPRAELALPCHLCWVINILCNNHNEIFKDNFMSTFWLRTSCARKRVDSRHLWLANFENGKWISFLGLVSAKIGKGNLFSEEKRSLHFIFFEKLNHFHFANQSGMLKIKKIKQEYSMI